MVFLLLLGSINYTLSLGYYLTFLLASLGIVCMFHTWLNFAHLKIEVLGAKPVFAGEQATIQLKLTENKRRARFTITAHFESNDATNTNLTANQHSVISIPLQTQTRGWQPVPKLTLYTEFPLGLFHAWSVIRHAQPIMVYAKPSQANTLSTNHVSAGQDKNHPNQMGDDEFSGHQSFKQGDPPSRLDWKASSRGMGMLTKRYSSNIQAVIWLDWAQTHGLAHEERISLLTKAVIDSHQTGLNFGLKLPNATIAPSRSEAHYHACCQALALL